MANGQLLIKKLIDNSLSFWHTMDFSEQTFGKSFGRECTPAFKRSVHGGSLSRKEAIMASATRLFAEKGFVGTSTVEIAEAAGVAHGTLFYHFKNKQGIIYEIFEKAGRQYLAELNTAVGGQACGIKKIDAIIGFHDDYSRRNQQQLLIFFRDFPGPLNSDSPLRDLIQSVHEEVIGLIGNCLQAGLADGTVDTDDIEKTACLINSMIFGVTHMNLMGPVPMPALTENAKAFCRRALAPG